MYCFFIKEENRGAVDSELSSAIFFNHTGTIHVPRLVPSSLSLPYNTEKSSCLKEWAMVIPTMVKNVKGMVKVVAKAKEATATATDNNVKYQCKKL